MSKFTTLSALALAAIVAVGCSDSSDPFSPESAPTPGFSDAALTSPDTDDKTQLLVKRISAIADDLLAIDARFAKVLLKVGPPDQPIDDAVRLEIARVHKNALTIASRADAYTGGTTPPPTDQGGAASILDGMASSDETQLLVKRIAAIADRLLKIDARFAKVLLKVGPPDQPIDDAVRLEIARVYTNATTIASRAEAYTGGTTPPPTDALP
jgi:hypothetical protein